jgi:hypothetical protein
MIRRIWPLLILYLPATLIAQYSTRLDSLYSINPQPSTRYILSASEITHLPVRGLTEYLNLFNGVVIQDGNVHIRGGRDDETAYFINGFSSTNPLENTNAIYVIPEAMEKIEVLPGFFPARYGGVNSGLVFTELKKGTRDYQFSVDYQTDKFATAGEQFLNTYSYRDRIVTATASGPAYFDNLYFFVALENTEIGDAAKRFSSGFTFADLVDQHWRFDDDIIVETEEQTGKTVPLKKIRISNTDDMPDTVTLNYPDGFTPFNNRNSWNVNATMQYDLNPLQFDLTLLYNWEEAYANNRPMLEILNNRQDFMRYNKWLAGLQMTHNISDQLQYDISFGYYDNRSEKYDAYFGNNWQLWDDSAAVAQATGGAVTYSRAYSDPYDYMISGFFIYPEGISPGDYQKTYQNYWSIGSRFEWKIKNTHHLRFGLNYKKYTIRQYQIDPHVMNFAQFYDGFEDLPASFHWDYSGNTYGYDFWGNEIEDGLEGPRNPVFAAIYLEDEIQLNNVIFNFGLRYDHIDSDDFTLKDKYNIPILGRTGLIAPDAWKEKKPVSQISPRIAISYHIDSQETFFFSYGKFIQLPKFNQTYFNNFSYSLQMVWGAWFYYQPPGVAPEPIYSTNYEIGYRKSLGSGMSASISGYYKKTTGLPNIETIIPDRGSYGTIFWTISNGDFSVVKGIELNIALNRFKRLHADLNYTFSLAEGTGSTPISYYNAVYYSWRSEPNIPTVPYPLDFNQRHRLALILDYRFGKNEGGIFENSGINLVSRVSSGHPYTYSKASTCG